MTYGMMICIGRGRVLPDAKWQNTQWSGKDAKGKDAKIASLPIFTIINVVCAEMYMVNRFVDFL